MGTGKTHAYILALTVHNIYSNRKAPAVISTSTIALQKALTEEYIPQISGILLEHHVIDKLLSFVVRKGKRHYVCDSRLKIYETSIKNLQREADAELILELARLGEQEFDRIDLDDTVLTPYVKGRINVFRCNKSCPYSLLCRFMNFKKKCMTDNFDFQSNGLLYIPERMPFPNIRDDRYIQAVMAEILQIVSATHGHTLILFTSYWLMERVFYGLKEQLSDYPLFLMGRGRLDVISSFRRSGNFGEISGHRTIHILHRMKETEGYGSSMGKLQDMRDAQREDIQKTDIMEVKKGDLLDIDTVTIDKTHPVEKKLKEFAAGKNGDLSTHLNEGYVVRVHFSRDDYSATDALKHYLKQIAELKY